MMTLARVSRWEYFFSDLAKTSLMMVWTALAVAAVLCLLRRWIARYPVATASALTFVAVQVPSYFPAPERNFWVEVKKVF